MKIAITGHRPHRLGNDYDLTSPLIQKIKMELQALLNDYLSHSTGNDIILISGMALGIDTLWAELAIENNLPLIAAIPCQNHDSLWTKASKERYHKILNHPLTEVVMVTNELYSGICMQKRNEYMVNNCDILVGVWNGSEGGTANCVKYAKSVGREIYLINPKRLTL